MLMLRVLFCFLCLFCSVNTTVYAESSDAMAQEILTYINQYRVSRGLPALTMNAEASRIARRHSEAMAKHQVPFGHDGFYKRMSSLRHAIPDTAGGAENVAYNYKTARIVVDGWIHSAGHRRNIVGRYDTTGIGIVRDSAGKLYFTQLFVHTQHHAHPVKTTRMTHTRRGFFIG